MAIKSILCVYGGATFESAALEAACQLATRCEAELRILHVVPPVVIYPDLYGVDLATLERENLGRAAHAEKSAGETARKAGLAFHLETDEVIDARPPKAIFAAITGYASDLVPAAGRACDLIIVGRDDMEVTDDIEAILAALLNTSTPTLIVPRGAEASAGIATAGQRVALAWDGSSGAGRALRGLQLVASAGQEIEVICIRPKSGRPLVCPADLAAHWLALHGFTARVTESGPFAMSDGEAILTKARQSKTDLLVMGAYGHSHWREVLLGGATDHVLKTGDLPLLLCH